MSRGLPSFCGIGFKLSVVLLQRVYRQFLQLLYQRIPRIGLYLNFLTAIVK